MRKRALLPGQFGPLYPNLGASVAKYRRMGPINEMDQPWRSQYGEAVCKAILALQRSELARELPSHRCPCASGSWHSDGEKILAAVRARQAALLQVNKPRSDAWIADAYAEAMRAKHAELNLAA